MKDQGSRDVESSRSVANEVGSGRFATQRFPAVAQFVKGGNSTLPILAPAQTQTNWCWAAVCSVIVGQTQQALANQFVGGANNQFDALNVLQAYNKHGATKLGKVPWDTLVDEVNAGRPIVMLFGPTNNAHYVLMIGYNGKSRADKNRKYVISDPEQLGGAAQALTSDELGSYRGNFIGYYLVT